MSQQQLLDWQHKGSKLMTRCWNALILVVVFCLCSGCGGGGGGGSSVNPDAGVYEGPYSRGGGTIVIEIGKSNQGDAVLSDDSGDTYVGTLTETGVRNHIYSGTLHDPLDPNKTINVNVTVARLGTTVSINGTVSGTFTASFTVNQVVISNSASASTAAGAYNGTSITTNAVGTQIDTGNANGTLTSTGIFHLDFTSNTLSGQTGSLAGIETSGGGIIGLITPPGGTEPTSFFGKVTQPTPSGIKVNITIPGSSPSETTNDAFTLTPGSAILFNGHYHGSSVTESNGSGSISAIDLTVSAGGTLSGVATDTITGTPVTLSGTIATNGNVTGNIGSHTFSGNLNFNFANQLAGTFTEQGVNGETDISLAGIGQLLIYHGFWNGSYNQNGVKVGDMSMTVNEDGSINGTLTPTGGSASSFTGTVTDQGQVSLILPGSVSGTGGVGLDSSGNLGFTFISSGGPITWASLSQN